MELGICLGASSLSDARMGISGLVLMAVFIGGGFWLIHFLGRHEYDVHSGGILGVLVAVMFGVLGGAVAGHVVVIYLLAGVAAFLSSGPFLGFKGKHRMILAGLLPALSLGSDWLGRLVEDWMVG
ncbi:MAG: hypothetical protein ACON4R_13625 [Akkermansiaceae bacterium]